MINVASDIDFSNSPIHNNNCGKPEFHSRRLEKKAILIYSTPNEYLPYFALVSVSPPCVSPSHGGFMETATVNSR